MPNNNQKGNAGEDFAISHLLKLGYNVLDKNWRYKHLEVDIIALHNNQLVIVEVKLRASNAFGQPEDFVSLKKQKNLIKAAHAYVIEKNLDYEVRFDVVSIIQNSNEFSLEHIIDAFYPTLK